MHWQLLTAVLVVAAPAPAEDKKKDEEKLQGTWIVVSGERDGMKLPDDKIKDLKVVIKDDTLTVGDEKTTFKLDAKKKPKTIDLVPIKKDGTKEDMVPGIYEIDGDDLKMCWAKGGKEADRPTEFATKKDSRNVLFILKREKPTKDK